MFILLGLICGAALAVVAKLRKYSTWEIIVWFAVGLILSILAVPVFFYRIIIEKKGLGIGLTSGILVVLGTTVLMYDFGRFLFGGGMFSSPELGLASVVGVLLIIGGLMIAFFTKNKEKSIQRKLSELDELDELLSKGAITDEEHAEMRKSILI